MVDIQVNVQVVKPLAGDELRKARAKNAKKRVSFNKTLNASYYNDSSEQAIDNQEIPRFPISLTVIFTETPLCCKFVGLSFFNLKKLKIQMSILREKM